MEYNNNYHSNLFSNGLVRERLPQEKYVVSKGGLYPTLGLIPRQVHRMTCSADSASRQLGTSSFFMIVGMDRPPTGDFLRTHRDAQVRSTPKPSYQFP